MRKIRQTRLHTRRGHTTQHKVPAAIFSISFSPNSSSAWMMSCCPFPQGRHVRWPSIVALLDKEEAEAAKGGGTGSSAMEIS